MSDGPRANEHSGDDEPVSGGSETPDQQGALQQPWDRPRRWNAERLDATRVDDLLARLRSDTDEPTTPRRRRRAAARENAAAQPAVNEAAAPAPQDPASPAQKSDPEATIASPSDSADSEATVMMPISDGPSSAGPPRPATGAAAGAAAGRVDAINHDLDSNTEILPIVAADSTARNNAEAVRESLRASLVGSSAAAPLGDPGPASLQNPPKPTSVTPPERAPHHYLKRTASVILALVSALVLGVTGVYANIIDNANTGLKANSVDVGLNPKPYVPPQPTDAAGSSAAALVPTVYAPENFLLVGSDTRAGANNIDGAQSQLNGDVNTDSLMVLHLSGDRQQITVISLPRDLWVENVPCQTWDSATDTYGADAESNSLARQHINSFFGVGGPRCLVDAVEKLTNLIITRYIQIDFSGFSSMVDALGGVTVNACGPIIDEQLATVLASGGEQRIDGAQALNLARARKVKGDTASDTARIHRQQLILSAILRGVKSAGTLLDPAKLNAFVAAFTQNTSTGGVDFQTLLALAESLGDLDPSKVTFYTLPTVTAEPADERGSMDIDTPRADLLLNAIRTDTPIPGTEPDAVASTSVDTPAGSTSPVANPTLTVAPDQINLIVVNAANQDGVAGVAAKQLIGFGYSVPDSALLRLDPDQTQDGVTVEYATGNEAAALTVAASSPGATLKVVENLGQDVRLVLGTSYDNNLVAAAVGDPIAAPLLAQVPEGAAGNVLAPSADPGAGTGDGTVPTADASAVVAEIPQVNAATGDCL